MKTTCRAVALLALGVTLAACTKTEGGDAYVKDGDTGASSPATVITPDTAGGPDSTSGMSQRTGAPGAAGTRQSTTGDSGMRSSSPASSAPKRP